MQGEGAGPSPNPLSLWRSLLGPGWLGFPSIVLGKEKGADRKMRLFQGIDSVTATVRRAWGGCGEQRRGGPGRRERHRDKVGSWGRLWASGYRPCSPRHSGIPGSGLQDSGGVETGRGRNRDSRARRKPVAEMPSQVHRNQAVTGPTHIRTPTLLFPPHTHSGQSVRAHGTGNSLKTDF